MERSHDSVLHPALLSPGTVVGPWRVVGWAGQGVYGAVYQAERVGQEQAGPVALKLALLPEDPRFTREVELLSRLDHPSVPRLLDHGEWQHCAGTLHPYITMEWVEGLPLYEHVREQPRSRPQTARMLAQLARALEAVHALGAVHRDVKGSNILVRRSDGRAFLTDFGSGLHPGAATLTPPRLLADTPAYRPPESMMFLLGCRKDPISRYVVGPADDLYALGVTAYRLVTGKYPELGEPFKDESGNLQLRERTLLPPRALNARVEPRLDALIIRLLSARPEARGTAKELAEALEQVVERAASQSSSSGLARGGEALATVGASPELASAQPSARPWRAWLALAVAGLSLVAESWLAGSGKPVEKPPVARLEAADSSMEDSGNVRLGEAALAEPTVGPPDASVSDVMAEDTLPEPLPGQTRPDVKGRCPGKGQLAINGGCWVRIPFERQACEESGYVFTSQCYGPVLSTRRRQPTYPSDEHRRSARRSGVTGRSTSWQPA